MDDVLVAELESAAEEPRHSASVLRELLRDAVEEIRRLDGLLDRERIAHNEMYGRRSNAQRPLE